VKASPQYEIRYSRARASRGLKPFGVFQQIDDVLWRAVSDHDTREEAEKALATLPSERPV
jgi:hypothetical protein